MAFSAPRDHAQLSEQYDIIDKRLTEVLADQRSVHDDVKTMSRVFEGMEEKNERLQQVVTTWQQNSHEASKTLSRVVDDQESLRGDVYTISRAMKEMEQKQETLQHIVIDQQKLLGRLETVSRAIKEQRNLQDDVKPIIRATKEMEQKQERLQQIVSDQPKLLEGFKTGSRAVDGLQEGQAKRKWLKTAPKQDHTARDVPAAKISKIPLLVEVGTQTARSEEYSTVMGQSPDIENASPLTEQNLRQRFERRARAGSAESEAFTPETYSSEWTEPVVSTTPDVWRAHSSALWAAVGSILRIYMQYKTANSQDGAPSNADRSTSVVRPNTATRGEARSAGQASGSRKLLGKRQKGSDDEDNLVRKRRKKTGDKGKESRMWTCPFRHLPLYWGKRCHNANIDSIAHLM